MLNPSEACSLRRKSASFIEKAGRVLEVKDLPGVQNVLRVEGHF